MRPFSIATVASAFVLAACGGPDSAPPAADGASAAAPSEVSATLGAATPEASAKVEMTAAPAGVYQTDPDHAYITFSYDHMGYSRPTVRWGEWSGELDWRPSAPETSSVSVTIDVASVDSGVEKFDAHLVSPDFFNAAEYPTIRFTSTSLDVAGPNSGTMTGDLTIKDVTKPITLDVTINKAADDPMAKAYKLGFSAKGAVKRSDFGVDRYAPAVGDDVVIAIEAEFTMPKEAPAEQ